MPYGVRKFPSSNDPRSPSFCQAGYAWGSLPPYKWRLSSAGALSPFGIFETGFVLPVTSWSDDSYLASTVFDDPEVWSIALLINGWYEPQSGPPDYTVRFEIAISYPSEGLYAGGFNLLWPNAIDEHLMGVFPAEPGMPNLLPNPVAITPVIWSTPDVG